MNVWAMFDPTTGTRTSGESPLAVNIQPGIVRGLALLGLVGATQVQIDIHDGESLVYSRTEAVGDTQMLLDWYRSEEHTSELQSLMRISYAVFCLKKKINTNYQSTDN